MPTQCFQPIRGKRIRATRLDECGNAPSGGTPESQVTTDGFISVSLTSEVESGVEIVTRKADGSLCVNDRGPDSFKRFTVGIGFCGVDPGLFDLVTNAVGYNDWNGDVNGIVVPEGTVDTKFALELWTGLTGAACPTGVEEASGYMLLPFVNAGVLGDLEINGENSIDFTMTGAFTMGGNTWGTGPYEVMDNAGSADVLPSPLDPSDHLLLTQTGISPPPVVCGLGAMPAA